MKNRTLMLRTILFAIAAIGLAACGDGGTDLDPDPEPDLVYPDPCFPNGCAPVDSDPAWSPNGSEIAVSSTYPDGDSIYDIHVIDTLGNAVRLTSGLAAGSSSWSPDGSRIAFHGWPGFGEGRRLYVVNRDGSGLTELLAPLRGLSGPAWSPDGETIAFSNENGLHLFDMATSVVTGLGVPGGALSWSPDGSQAVFAWDGVLSRMEADGSGVVALFAGVALFPGDGVRDTTWSPCTEIAFSVLESSTSDRVTSFIHVMDSDGSNVRKLPIEGTEPSWSPDCSKIVFAGPAVTIQIINADGSGLRTLTRR